MVTPAARRSIVIHLKDGFQFSERQACIIVGLCRSSCRYQAKPSNDAEIRTRLRELAEQRRKFGSPRLHTLLLREGRVINHKRTERLYKEEGLSLRLKKRKKRVSHLRVVMDRPDRINQHWSMARVPGTSMISFVKGKPEISHNFPNCHRQFSCCSFLALQPF